MALPHPRHYTVKTTAEFAALKAELTEQVRVGGAGGAGGAGGDGVAARYRLSARRARCYLAATGDRTELAGARNPNHETQETQMATKNSGKGVYRVIDVIGTSKTSWEDADQECGGNGVEVAARPARRRITQMDMKVEDGKVVAYAPGCRVVVQVRGLRQRPGGTEGRAAQAGEGAGRAHKQSRLTACTTL